MTCAKLVLVEIELFIKSLPKANYFDTAINFSCRRDLKNLKDFVNVTLKKNSRSDCMNRFHVGLKSNHG